MILNGVIDCFSFEHLFILCYFCLFYAQKKLGVGVKRKADTTTPGTVLLPSPDVRPPSKSIIDMLVSTPASIGNRRESSRPVKKPKKDLDDDQIQHSSKAKKEPLTEQLKFCGVVLRELMSKKHAVSIFE